MPRLYRDYIKVDPNFIPVFSKNSDKTYPDKWQSFYPHESFKSILTEVVDTLEKTTETKNKSLWMSGAYGTGKTYASFVIKHILEDDIDSIEPYFVNNGMQSLYARVKGIRAKGKTLVVQRSSASNIDNQNRLFNAIIESVKEAVKSAGLDYIGSESLLEKVITTLRDENSSFNFSGAFNKYRSKFTMYSSPDDVIDDLEELDMEEKLDLLDTVLEVAESEGFSWSLSPDEIINWLEDVRKGNDLYSIVFIWDEFTEYFKNNQNKIGGLQEIAMADSRIGFYFFLITHSSAGQLVQDKAARTIIEARFKMSQIQLEESTAFKLLGQALHHEADLQSEWEGVCDDLWAGVKKGSVDVIKNKDISIKDDDFKNLLPLHPYAAYLLKIIAKDISSNQRTIFQFLSGDYSEDDLRKNFNWFIDNTAYDFGKWNYLTADFLWDYFLNDKNTDLDQTFLNAMSHFGNFVSLCRNDNEIKVLKVTLLLAALQAKNGADSRNGATSLMRPTLANIKACFAGTPFESNVESTLEFFANKGIVGKVEGTNEVLFVMTSASVDKERWNKCFEEVSKQITFDKLIGEPSYSVADQFKPQAKFLEHRLAIYYVSPTNAKAVADGADSAPNHIPTFYLYARDEGDQAKISDTIKVIYEKVGKKCIVVDFSGTPFTKDLFDKFIKSKTDEKYYSTLPNQKPQYDLAKTTSAGILKEWIKKLNTTSLNIYTSETSVVTKSGGANLRIELKNANNHFFGCGCEELTQNDKLFEEKGFKETVAQMGMAKITVPSNYSYLAYISKKLDAIDAWANPKYFELHPQDVISKMKIAVNEVIDKSFADKSMVDITDIWKVLTNAPYGLMPNTGSVFILGFLLKDYADSNYYKRDLNSNTVALNYTDLSELVYGVIKDLPKARGQFIVKQTPEQKQFCQKTGEIFKIAKEKRNSLDDIQKNINIYLTNNSYPLWSMRYYIDEELYDHVYKDSLLDLCDLLCEFVKPELTADRDRSKIADDIYHCYHENNSIEEVFGDILNVENMRKGMVYYIVQTKPDLSKVAARLKIESKDYLEMLNKKLSNDSSYLWDKGDIDHQINNLYIDLKLIDVIDGLLTTKESAFANARESLIKKLNAIRIPDALLKELRPELSPIMVQLYAIKDNTITDKPDTIRVITNMTEEFLKFFNGQYDVFSTAISKSLGEALQSDELESLFNSTPSGTLFKTTDEFALSMRSELKKYRKSKKTRIMFEAWKSQTGTDSPSVWSSINSIPILCMFTDNLSKAQRVFDALNKTAFLPNDTDIDDAIDFINSGALDVLKDKAACEKAFIDVFCGDYAYVIDSADELRDEIRSVAGTKVYEWFAAVNKCKVSIKNYATGIYGSKYKSKARDEIKKLTAEQAQEYLNKLIEDDPLLGIRILKK